MRSLLLISALSALSLPLLAQQRDEKPAWSLDIDKVEVVTDRHIKDIGVQKVVMDTVTLHDNIALSLADILTQNSTVFIKSYGRATLSTASFRGTSASHTQVLWNGMKLNSPMLGMTDFSMIPAYFIDNASLYFGASSAGIAGGGLGGAVSLSTRPTDERGFGLQFIQGIGWFTTFDEYLRFTYADEHWQVSTRAVYSDSRNDFKYTNYRKKTNMVFDEYGRVVSFDYPVERNKCGDFHDLHLLQEIYYNSGTGHRVGLAAWYVNSRRGIPMLNVDYRNGADYRNRQNEQTFRGILSWDMIRGSLKVGAKAGYIHTSLGYDYSRATGGGVWSQMTRSRSYVNTVYAAANAEYYIGRKWLFTADVTLHQNFVESRDRNIIRQDGNRAVIGYDKARIELSGYVSAKWMPAERFGISVSLRDDFYGTEFTPIIPAAFIDWVISKRGNVVMKASVSRNYRYPTLNDLYFLPGGNAALRPERGFTYDGGISFRAGGERFSTGGEVTAYDSYIKDWICWLPTAKGFWSPVNIKEVHSYGIEAKADISWRFARDWRLRLDGNYAWTPSINRGDPTNWADESIGKQLVYIPRHSAAVTGRLDWRSWSLTYKWCWYGERYTTSSNETATRFDRLGPYFMSDLSLEKRFAFRRASLSFKGVVNNLFNEEYESVLSRPMPRLNCEFFIEICPKFKSGHRNDR
ncbi:MAG: TonB-dependent receptor plug domain-containing protein [Alistipes sp.]|nr:TonB-dependent receptor plug domain-containing protein [Alistipes sp.]